MLRKIIPLLLLCPCLSMAQEKEENKEAGRLMIGYRSTISAFSDAGFAGFGSGAQFRLQFGPKLNSEWYYDHISTNLGGLGRRTDEHIGWSVMYYAFGQHTEKGKFTPYMEAGNCFDYTAVRTSYKNGTLASRGSAAVHLGLGTHYNLSEKVDITLKAQYMIHIGTNVDEKIVTDDISHQRYLVITSGETGLNGHLLITCSVNILLADLWKGYLFGTHSKNL
jgi:hypothetical protein